MKGGLFGFALGYISGYAARKVTIHVCYFALAAAAFAAGHYFR